jgi:low affinity Fe/Cu permease
MTVGDETGDSGTAMAPSHPPRSSGLLHRLGDATSNSVAGLVAAITAACWLVVGAFTRFPTWWQVCLYSSTAIVTFVMVFVIQHTQSKQIAALQRKLDELIRSSYRADNALISVEQAPPVELQQLATVYRDQRNDAVGD